MESAEYMFAHLLTSFPSLRGMHDKWSIHAAGCTALGLAVSYLKWLAAYQSSKKSHVDVEEERVVSTWTKAK